MSNKIIIERGNLADVPRIIDFVVGWMHSNKLKKLSFYVETAVDEAVTNVFTHGYAGNGGYISVRCQITGNEVEIIINDNGIQFDPAKVPLPDLSSDLQDRRVGGLGIYIMRQMMDAVEYNFDAISGNELTLRKKIPACD
jgi:anti-sigma regulatory factor (Ser/Thr protein kinase)